MEPMTEWPPLYRHYLSTPEVAKPDFAPSLEAIGSVVVVSNRRGSWNAVWQGETSALGEFEGTKQDAIDWARQRSDRCWVYSEELDKMVLLDPDDDGDQG